MKPKTFKDMQDDLRSKEPYLALALEVVGKVMAKRDRNGWTQAELAQRANIPVDVLEDIENGDIIPGAATLNRLLDVTGLKITLDVEDK